MVQTADITGVADQFFAVLLVIFVLVLLVQIVSAIVAVIPAVNGGNYESK